MVCDYVQLFQTFDRSTGVKYCRRTDDRTHRCPTYEYIAHCIAMYGKDRSAPVVDHRLLGLSIKPTIKHVHDVRRVPRVAIGR